MKKRSKLIVLVSIVLLVFCTYTPVSADSGWDASYGGGGISIGGGGFSSSGSGGVSIEGGDSIISLIFTLVCLIFSAVFIAAKSKNDIVPENNGNYNFEDNGDVIIPKDRRDYRGINYTKVKSLDPTFDIDKFKQQAFDIYKNLQVAWMNFDTDKIQKLTTDELYNMYCSQLDILKLKKQKNIMAEIKLKDIYVTNMNVKNNVISIMVYLKVTCYDYVIEEETTNVVRGTNTDKLSISYALTFVKSGVNNKKIEKCPNCGAPVDITSSAKCEYCDSILVKDASDFVLSKKECVGQTTLRRW